MKRIKSAWIRLLVMALSIAMIIGCFGGVVLADDENDPVTPPEFSALHTTGEVQSKVKLGESFNVPAKGENVTVTVKAPNGEKLEPTDGKYVAGDIGNYTIEYSVNDSDAKYYYVINCYEENDYFIHVANGGATIPTYIGSGKSFTLPEWKLAYVDEDDELVFPDDTVSVVTLNEKTIDKDANGKYVVSFPEGETKTYTLTLSAGFNMNKLYKQQYTINVQSGFSDTKSPTLKNISNMPSSASLKTKVELPKATAEDDYDENVLILVTVTDPSGNTVKQVEQPNKQGYAEKETAEAVNFDNDRVMSFYPMNNGTYTVTYTAVDDANPDATELVEKGNTSAKHEYRITVSDKTGPIITDIDDSKIPNVWGLESVTKAENQTLSSNVLYLPIPEVVDNQNAFAITKNEDGSFAGSGDVNLTIEIKNPNNTVAKFDRLSAETVAKADSKIDSTNSTYGEYFKDGNDNNVAIVNHDGELAVKLDFNAFYQDETNASKTKAGIVGTWTVTYSVRDAAGNGGYNASQKSYSINVKELSFVDSTAPEIETPTLNEYLIIGGEETEFTVPNIVASDDNDARLNEKYFLVCGEDNKFEVEGGETLEIVNEEGKFYFKNDDDEKFELKGETLEFEFSATDDAGNESKLVMPKDDEDDDNVNYSIKIHKITEAGFDANNIKFTFNEEEIKAGTSEDQMLGSFVVSKIGQPEFLGFEIALTDGNGDLVKTSSYMYYTESKEEESEEEQDTVYDLHVENITCSLSKGGTYLLTVRVFDAKGNSSAYAKTFEVTKENEHSELKGKNAAVAWESSASVGTAYSLKRETTIVKGDNNIAVYGVEGSKYSMLGYDFTPLASGSYTIKELHGEEEAFNGEEGFMADKLIADSIYGMTATDSKSVTYEILGVLPAYLKKYERPQDTNTYQAPDADGTEYFYVTAPFIAYSEGVNYDIEMSYTKPGGNSSSNKANKIYEHTGEDGKVVYSFDKKSGEFYGRFALVLDEHGTYNLTVSAVGVSGSSKTYTIKVGDTTKPQFKLDTSKQDMRVGDTFEYREFEFIPGSASDPGYDKEDEIRVSYKLVEPGSTGEVSSVSASNKTLTSLKKGSNVIKIETSEYTFTKSGSYTVVIELSDKAGNVNKLTYTISVNSTANSTPTSLTMLSTVLIIVGVLLILGVIVYLIRFRKRRA